MRTFFFFESTQITFEGQSDIHYLPQVYVKRSTSMVSCSSCTCRLYLQGLRYTAANNDLFRMPTSIQQENLLQSELAWQAAGWEILERTIPGVVHSIKKWQKKRITYFFKYYIYFFDASDGIQTIYITLFLMHVNIIISMRFKMF